MTNLPSLQLRSSRRTVLSAPFAILEPMFADATLTLEDRLIDGAGRLAAAQCRRLKDLGKLDEQQGDALAEFASTASWVGWGYSQDKPERYSSHAWKVLERSYLSTISRSSALLLSSAVDRV